MGHFNALVLSGTVLLPFGTNFIRTLRYRTSVWIFSQVSRNLRIKLTAAQVIAKTQTLYLEVLNLLPIFN